jgi:hypothetical protein
MVNVLLLLFFVEELGLVIPGLLGEIIKTLKTTFLFSKPTPGFDNKNSSFAKLPDCLTSFRMSSGCALADTVNWFRF